jgi:hypothetical protein
MSYINKNKEVLLKQYPGLWENINSKDKNDIEFKDLKIETSQTGDPVLLINGMYIHSSRDPLREGQRIAQTCEQTAGEGKRAVVILGFGLGYSAQCVAQCAAEIGMPVIVVEKHKSLLIKALELRDFSEFLGKNRIIFVIGGSGDAITSALSIADEIISDGNKNTKKNAPYIINNKALTGFDEQWYKQIEEKVRSWTMKDDINTATHRRFGQRWVRNFLRNMSAIRDCPGILRLSNLASVSIFRKPFPVFLAAAGPSLDKIKLLLNDIQKRCVIVAVDTNLRFFVDNGIQPDFVLVADPQFWNSRHLDHCVCEKNKLQTALIAEPAVYPPVLNLPFKNKFLCSSMLPVGKFIEKQVDEKGRLGAGGSVASSAWDFARFLGTKEIWIAGLDLAFPDLKTHFRGARFEEISNSQSNRFNPAEKWVAHALRDGSPFKARSVSGGQVTTDKRLSLYAAWFENQFSQNKQIQNYSLFHEGLAINGLRAANSKKLLALPKRRVEIDRHIQKTFSEIENAFNAPEEKHGRAKKFDNAVYALTHGFEDMRTVAEEGAEIVRRALKPANYSGKQNEITKKLDEITRQIMESEVKEIADFLSAAVVKEEAKESFLPKNNPFNAYLNKSLKLFLEIINSARFHLMRVR